MGRPLKIAKATTTSVTSTALSGSVVTVTSTTNFDVGQRFTVSTTIGNITAGVVYYIKSIIDATTLTLSSTWNGPVLALTDVTATVAATIGLTDSGYDSPTGSANTYGVVGGKTGIYNGQILPRVAIAVPGIGTISSVLGNTQVYGALTDFANTAATGSWIEVDGVGVLGNVASIAATVASNGTVASGNLVNVTSNTTFIINAPITVSANTGGNSTNLGLVTGVVYYVAAKAAGAIAVSATPGGANIQMTTTSNASSVLQDVVTLVAGSAKTVSNSAWTHSLNEAGSILRQKGRNKFLVQGASGLIGACFTANVANAALTAGQMNMVATDASAANVFVDRIGAHVARGFGNTDAALQYTATFNTAYAANTNDGQPYPIVTIAKL